MTIQTLIDHIIEGDPKTFPAALATYLQTPGADIDALDHSRGAPSTLLMIAAYLRRMPIIILLLEHGANINHVEVSTGTALKWAVRSGDRQVVTFLLDQNADINLGHTALIEAAKEMVEWRGHLNMVTLLLNRGANINAQAHDGNALTHSVKSWMFDYDPERMAPDRMAVTELLINKGAAYLPDQFQKLHLYFPFDMFTHDRRLIYKMFENANRLFPTSPLFNSKIKYEIVQHNNKIKELAETIGFELARQTPLMSDASNVVNDYLFESEDCRKSLTYEFNRACKNPSLKRCSEDKSVFNRCTIS